MNPCIHVLRNSLLSLALLGAISGPTSAAAQSVSSEETVRSARIAFRRRRGKDCANGLFRHSRPGDARLCRQSFRLSGPRYVRHDAE